MSVWGVGLFDDDTAVDVRAKYEEALEDGLDAVAATEQVLDSMRQMLDDVEDGPVIWMALAALQLEHGAVLPVVRRQAIVAIDSGADIERWREGASPEDAKERATVLDELRARLIDPQPG